jgi:M6 family metalloprotease-like protein
MVKRLSYMKHIFALFALLVATCFPAFSVGANPNPIEVLQPDGTTLQIKVRGHEWNRWTSTVDGYHVVKNSNGIYEYAKAYNSGIAEASGLKANNIGNRTDGERAFVRQMPTMQVGKLPASSKENMLKAAQMVSQNKSGTLLSVRSGSFKLLVIMANFSNTSVTHAAPKFELMMNEPNYQGTGSFRDYYLENSNGQLDVSSVVTAWVTVPNPHDYYGPEEKWGEFAYEAIKAAYNSGVDLSPFDNNGDGVVDAVAIIHQGKGQESTADETDIWSHSWTLASAGYSSTQRRFGNVRVNNYIVQPELNSNTQEMASIGVIAHEFAHALGAYDFYDTDYEVNGQQSGTGTWDLMDNGCYNGNPTGAVPAHHNPYTKIQLGWVSATVIDAPGWLNLPPIISSQTVFRVNTATANEYYLFEHRKKAGFDAFLRGEGMVVYHVDDAAIAKYGESNELNTTSRKAMYIKPAGGKLNNASCTFPGSNNISFFHDDTDPSMRAWNGGATNKSITNIALRDDTVRFYFMAYQNGLPKSFSGLLTNETEVELSWIRSNATSNLVVAYSPDSVFGKPVDGNLYSVGSLIPGGGEVVYSGNVETSVNHKVLPGLSYYYRVWAQNEIGYTSPMDTKVDGYKSILFFLANKDGAPIDDASVACGAYNGSTDKDGMLQFYGNFPTSQIHRFVVRKEGFNDYWGVFTSETSKSIRIDMVPLSVWEPMWVDKSINGKQVAFNWNPIVDDGFEAYQGFSSSIGSWTMVDNDKLPTYSFDEIDYNNEGDPLSFIVFDGYDDSFISKNVAVDSHTGRQFLACIASPVPSNKPSATNDDWLISPEIMVDSSAWLSFYAASISIDWGLERLRVLVSTNGEEITDFQLISPGKYMRIPTDWTFIKFDLSAYSGKKIRVALNCVSADAFMLMVDNIRITKAEPFETSSALKSLSFQNKRIGLDKLQKTVATSSTIEKSVRQFTPNQTNTVDGSISYHLYRGDDLVATLNGMSATTYIDHLPDCGLWSYRIVAVDNIYGNAVASASMTFRNCLSSSYYYSKASNGVVGIQLPDGVTEAEYNVFNANGQLLKSGYSVGFQFSIDLTSLPTSVYLCAV